MSSVTTGKIPSASIPENRASRAVTSAGMTPFRVPPVALSPTRPGGATDDCGSNRLHSPNRAAYTHSSRPPRQTAEADQELTAFVVATLQAHVEDRGMCLGCELGFGQLKPFPCDQARWAADVVARADVARTQAAETPSCYGAQG